MPNFCSIIMVFRAKKAAVSIVNAKWIPVAKGTEFCNGNIEESGKL